MSGAAGSITQQGLNFYGSPSNLPGPATDKQYHQIGSAAKDRAYHNHQAALQRRFFATGAPSPWLTEPHYREK